MFHIDPDKQVLVLDLKEQLGRSAAESIVAILWLYVTNSEEDKARLSSVIKMIRGEEPLSEFDATELVPNVL